MPERNSCFVQPQLMAANRNPWQINTITMNIWGYTTLRCTRFTNCKHYQLNFLKSSFGKECTFHYEQENIVALNPTGLLFPRSIADILLVNVHDSTKVISYSWNHNSLQICDWNLFSGVFDLMTKVADATGPGYTWACNVCGYSSRQTLSNVKRHIILKHSKNERLQCPGCSKVLRNKEQFNKHVLAAHREIYDIHKYSITNSTYQFW